MKLDFSKISNEDLLENLEFFISDYTEDFKNISNRFLVLDKNEKYRKKTTEFKFYKNLFDALSSLNGTNKNYIMFLKEARKRKIVKKDYYNKNLNYLIERN